MSRLLFLGTLDILQSDSLTAVVPVVQSASRLADSILTDCAFPQMDDQKQA